MKRVLRLGSGLLPFLVVVGACADQGPPGSAALAGPGQAEVALAVGEELESPLGDYLAGQFALESGRLSEAADFFSRALAADPENLDLTRQVFLLTLASGRYDEALIQARQLLRQDPEAEEAQLLVGLNEARAGDFAMARVSFATVSADGIATLTVPFLDAWAVFGGGEASAVDKALLRLDSGQSLGPLNNYHKAMLLYLGGRAEEAVPELGGAMPEGSPAPVRMVQAYASMLARTGAQASAIEMVRGQLDGRDRPLLNNVLNMLEKGQVPPPPFDDATGGMADALLGIAEALNQERGAARAVVFARLALFIKPELAEASLLIGDIMAQQDNLDAAVEAYSSVARESPYHFTAQLRIARALHGLERPEEAYALLDRLAEAYPDRIEALVQLGDLLRRDEQYARAEKAYSRAVERLGQPQKRHWTIFYARGITYERTKRWSQAEADFLKALELEPEQPFVLNYLGYSWVDQGINLDRAKEMLNRAVELRPNDGFIVDSLGWVYYRLGEYEAAVEQLERAVELEPGDPIINDHLGDAYWRVGRQREARFQWRRALSLGPEDDAIAAIERKLRSGLSGKNADRDQS